MTKRRGRPRASTVKRESNGQKLRSAPVKPEFVVAQRESLVGKDQATNPIAGQPIGILLLNKFVTQAQFLAADNFERDWKRWISLTGAGPHHTRATERDGGGMGQDPSDASYSRARIAHEGASACLNACEQSKLIWSILDTLLMECVLPHTWKTASGLVLPDIVTVALRRGLDALCRHYRIKEERAA
jgi:hypothetical protein